MAAKLPSLLPREHGAYAQLGVALLCALSLAPGWQSLAQALLTGTLFFASEPLLIVLGQRGPAALAAARNAAYTRLATLGALATLALGGAWSGSPVTFAWALLPPALLGLALFGLFLAGRERTGPGEVLAAWAFAAAMPPVVVLGGGSWRQAILLALLVGALFTLGTAVVHGHLQALRRGGRPSPPVSPRLMAFLLGGVFTAVAGALGARGLLPSWAWTALLPMTLAALGIWRFPPAPHRLKAVGWAAAGAALIGGTLAVLSLR